MKKEKYQQTWFVFCIAMISCFLWGSAFPCIKLGYRWWRIKSDDWAGQLLFAGFRFALAGLLVIIFMSMIEKKILVPKKTSLVPIGWLSLFQTVLQYLFFYLGLAHTSGVKASVIIGSNVFVAYVIAGLIFKLEQFKLYKMIGCFFGFAGVMLVNLSGGGWNFQFHFMGEGFIFLSTIAYACSSVLLKKYGKIDNTVVLSGYQFLFGGIVLIIIGMIFGGSISTMNVNGKGLLMLGYLAFISAMAYSLWAMLLKYNDVSRVTIFGCMNPIFGVVLSFVLLNENQVLNPLAVVIALLLVCIGMLLVNRKKRTK